MARRRDKARERGVALDRIDALLRLAETEPAGRSERASRYVTLARRIAMRYQVSIPRHWRRRICRTCDTLLVPGRNATYRGRDHKSVVTCGGCGAVARYPLRTRTPTAG